MERMAAKAAFLFFMEEILCFKQKVNRRDSTSRSTIIDYMARNTLLPPENKVIEGHSGTRRVR